MADPATLCSPAPAFVPAPLPANEPERLAALRALGVLDTAEEERFDRIVRLVARLFRVPVAFVSLIEEHRQWFKARVGVPMAEVPRATSFCGYAILDDEVLLVPDATLDVRFAQNPFVISEPYIRFYAGRSLRVGGGLKVGTLCMMDLQPRTFDSDERSLFEDLAALVERELTLTGTIDAQQETIALKEELLGSQRMLSELYRDLAHEKNKSEDLLLQILPVSVADELKKTGSVRPVHYPCATVLFTDFVGFTRLMEKSAPEQLVEALHVCFTEFDRIVARHSVEKVKTIGDGYLAVAGIAGQSSQHAHHAVRAALEMRDFIAQASSERRAAGLDAWEVRIGLHSGPVVAGVVGMNKFAYDVWGDTVNVASRLESTGEPGQLHVSQATWDLVRDEFLGEARGTVPLRNHESIEAFFIHGPRVSER